MEEIVRDLTTILILNFHPTTAPHPIPARLRTATVPEPPTIILLGDALDPVRDSLDFVLFGLISGYKMDGSFASCWSLPAS